MHAIISDSCYAVYVHHSSLCSEPEGVNPVDVDAVVLGVLLKRNLGATTA